MNELQQKAFKNMLKGLESLGCSYIVIDADGADYRYGDALAPKKKKSKHPKGALRDHYWPLIKNLKPGETAEVQVGPYSMDDIQSGMCSKASTAWGAGSYVTSRDVTTKTISIFRAY